MRLPVSVRDEVARVLRRREPDADIVEVEPVVGGCINNGARVAVTGGRSYFLKWNASAPSRMFEAEADGLAALRSAASTLTADVRPRVPEAHETGGGDDGPDWLLMEWIAPGRGATASEERLGRGLAMLHDLDPSDASPPSFGWHADNWIGSLPQSNREHASWSDFWREERIVPQLELAREGGHLADGVMDDLVARIPDALDGVSGASLLHGDLWSGNTYVTDDGASALVDPAVYRGDGEVDLAMTELFGGFGAAFYDAYRDTRGISDAYASHRRSLYQLYYLLVHVNLFGRSYVAGSLRTAERVVATLG